MRIYHLVLLVYCPLISHAAPAPPLIGGAPIVDAVADAKDTRLIKLSEENTAGEKLSHGLQLDGARSGEGDSMHSSLGDTDDTKFFQPKGQVDMGDTLVNSRLGSESQPSHMATTGTGLPEQQSPMVIYDEFLEEASEITEKSLWENIFGPVSKALADRGKQPIKEVPGYDPEWLKRTRLRGVTNPENLVRFRDKIGGMDQGRNAIIKVDPRDPVPLEKMISEDLKTYYAARDYYKNLLGSAEFERRMKVSNSQYDQLRIMKGWLDESKKIAAQLKIPPWEVEQAGKLFGADKFFTSFEDMDRGQALQKINVMRDRRPALYNKMRAFIGPAEFERRISLLSTLNKFRDIKIPPKHLSAWQMQDLDVDRMVTVWAHSQPRDVNGERLSMVQSAMRKDSKPLKKKEYELFLGRSRSGQPWKDSLEHDQLSRVSAGANNYRRSRQMVSEAASTWVRTPSFKKNPALVDQGRAAMDQERASLTPEKSLVGQERASGGAQRVLAAQESLKLSRPKQGNLNAIWRNIKPARILRGEITRALKFPKVQKRLGLRSMLL